MSKTMTKSKQQSIKVKAGNQITIETNCRVFKQSFDGVELIIEGYPDIRLGAHYIGGTYTITELHSGMMLFNCPESENYMQLVINMIDKIIEVKGTKQYLDQVERFKIIPSEYEWRKLWEELENIIQIPELRKIITGRLSANVLELGLLEHEIYLKNRIGQQQSSDKFYNNQSCKTYILKNYGSRAIELIEILSNH